MAYTTIDDPSAYFQTAIYTGNGSTIDVVNDGNSDLQPDWLWFKCRSNNTDHGLQDSVRGTALALQSNANSADADVGTSQITAFGSDGFSLASGGDVNTNNRTYVCWQWKKSATPGFDIVAFTGNATARTISHSLSAVPKMYMVKNRSANSTQWRVYHASLGATKHMALDATQAVGDAASVFNDTEPTSSVFSVGTDTGANGNGNSLICYLFAEKKGYSKFGSYVGNGNANGPFVYTGFKPAFIIRKRSDGAVDWRMDDNKRRSYNAIDFTLFPNKNNAETQSAGYAVDLLSNGFKVRGDSGNQNTNGGTYIYMAFAEQPFVTSTGVPATAR